MAISPAPFLRIGFAILGLGLALGTWSESMAALGWPALASGGLAFLIVMGIGETVSRLIRGPTEVRPDLKDRVRRLD